MLEFLFCFVVMSGILKASMTLLGFAIVDLTLLSLLLYTSYFLYHIATQKIFFSREKILFIIFTLLFYSFNILSLLWAKHMDLGLHKFTLSIIPLYIVLTFPFFSDFNFNRFCKIFIIFSILSSFIFLVFSIQYRLGIMESADNAERVKTLYLTIGGVLSIAILMLITNKGIILNFKKSLTLFFFLVLFVSAARGPLVFLILVLLIYYWQSLVVKFLGGVSLLLDKERLLNKVGYFVFFTMILAFLITISPSISGEAEKIFYGSLERILQLFGDDKGDSIGYRYTMINLTLAGIEESFLFGVGYGNFSPAILSEIKYYYPHNFILEVWVETGLVGLFLCIVFVLYPFFGRGLEPTILFITLFLLLNALKSFSLAENRVLFSFLVLLICCKSSIKDKRRNDI